MAGYFQAQLMPRASSDVAISYPDPKCPTFMSWVMYPRLDNIGISIAEASSIISTTRS